MSEDGYSHSRLKPWNHWQLVAITPCFLSMIVFSKYVLDCYLGSGWTMLCSLLFSALFAAPFCYVQFRLGSVEGAGMLHVFKDYFPLANIAGVAALCTNLVKLLVGVCFLTYCLAYVFFTYYHCDGRHCVGSLYIWGSCRDGWSEGDCREGYEMVYTGPTAEEKFLRNYVLERSDSISPLYGFPSWFLTNACVVVSYLIAWFFVFLLTISGHRIFGLILYGLAPLTIALLLGTVITVGVNYANAADQLYTYVGRFYTTFASIVPVDQYARDQFEVQPLIWGWLSTFVHLSQALNLWTGVFPLLGKWCGPDGKRSHTGWIPLLICWRLLIELPVLLFLFALASSYDPTYARCHLSTDWQAPFLILTHVVSKFSSHRLLTGCLFIALLLCILLSQSLLLLTTIRNITDYFAPPLTASRKRQHCVYRTVLTVAVVLLVLLGLPMITRSGFYWIRLVDWYVDRMLVITATLQAVGYSIAYARSRDTRVPHPMMKLGFLVGYSVLTVLSAAVYLWYAVATVQTSPDTLCPTFDRAPDNDPIHSEFRLLGWLIATGPLIVGLLFTLIAAGKQAARTTQSFCSTLVRGERFNLHRTNRYEPGLRMVVRRYSDLETDDYYRSNR